MKKLGLKQTQIRINKTKKPHAEACEFRLERVTGLEPVQPAWKVGL